MCTGAAALTIFSMARESLIAAAATENGGAAEYLYLMGLDGGFAVL